MTSALLIRGRVGLGDQIYQRAIVRELTTRYNVYLETPWPQLVRDLPIRCVKRPTTLRTQAKNAARPDAVWYTPPSGLKPVVAGYAGHSGTMLAGFCATLGVNPARITFDLPAFERFSFPRPYVVVRPATIRKEWPAAARNPLPQYLRYATEAVRDKFAVISVADLDPAHEWPLEPLPHADVSFHRGELPVERLMALIAGASGVITGVGWALPAAVAYRVPLFAIFGGCGQHDGPSRVFDPRMPTGSVTNAIPERLCMCANRQHDCDKRIATLGFQVEQWALGLRPRSEASMAAGVGSGVPTAG
jgi:hypothetical protein